MNKENVPSNMSVVEVGEARYAFHRRIPLTFSLVGVMGFWTEDEYED